MSDIERLRQEQDQAVLAWADAYETFDADAIDAATARLHEVTVRLRAARAALHPEPLQAP